MQLLKIIFFLSLFFLFASCDKPSEVVQHTIDIEINKTDQIALGSLTIYPITKKRNQSSHYLTIQELKKEKGVVFKNGIPEEQFYTQTFVVANKSIYEAILPYGNIFKNDNDTYVLSQELGFIAAKQITPIQYETILQGSYNTTTNPKFLPILMCPPTPLHYFLSGKKVQTETWLREALPLLDFPVTEKRLNISNDFFRNKQQENDELSPIRIPMEDLFSIDDFTAYFDRIGQSPNVCGYLAVYKGKIVQAQLFDQTDFFRKEWPAMITAIFLNQKMGFSTNEFNQLSPFDGLQAAKAHTQKLWSKSQIFPKDKAYRGDIEEKPFQLIWY